MGFHWILISMSILSNWYYSWPENKNFISQKSHGFRNHFQSALRHRWDHSRKKLQQKCMWMSLFLEYLITSLYAHRDYCIAAVVVNEITQGLLSALRPAGMTCVDTINCFYPPKHADCIHTGPNHPLSSGGTFLGEWLLAPTKPLTGTTQII